MRFKDTTLQVVLVRANGQASNLCDQLAIAYVPIENRRAEMNNRPRRQLGLRQPRGGACGYPVADETLCLVWFDRTTID